MTILPGSSYALRWPTTRDLAPGMMTHSVLPPFFAGEFR